MKKEKKKLSPLPVLQSQNQPLFTSESPNFPTPTSQYSINHPARQARHLVDKIPITVCEKELVLFSVI